MKIVLSIMLALGFGHATFGMQGAQEAMPDDAHSVVVTCFLGRYAIAEFCDIDECGAYYNPITATDDDTCFMLPWPRVKTVLDKAYQDLARFDVSKEDVGLNKEYRKSLWQIQRNLDPAVYENSTYNTYKQVCESRKKYRAAWESGDITQIKAVLKANRELWPPHID